MEKEKKALCAVGTTSELMTHQTLLRHQPKEGWCDPTYDSKTLLKKDRKVV